MPVVAMLAMLLLTVCPVFSWHALALLSMAGATPLAV
jgi:hypothetical protein